jgi:hypothetical protein
MPTLSSREIILSTSKAAISKQLVERQTKTLAAKIPIKGEKWETQGIYSRAKIDAMQILVEHEILHHCCLRSFLLPFERFCEESVKCVGRLV